NLSRDYSVRGNLSDRVGVDHIHPGNIADRREIPARSRMMQATNKLQGGSLQMNAISRRLIIAGLVTGGLLAAPPVSAQQFTMKLSMPTINDILHEYYKQVKAGVEQRSGGKI